MKHIAKPGEFVKRALSVVLCGAMVLSSSGISTMAAYAAEPTSEASVTSTVSDADTQDATESNQAETETSVAATLTPTLHGDLEFVSDSGLDTLKVSSNSSVSVRVTSDEYYEVAGIVAVDESGNALDGYLCGDIFTFYIEEEDATVYADFEFNNSISLAEVDETEKPQDTLSYILENADSKYVGKSSGSLTADDAYDALRVKQSIYDSTKLPADITDADDVLTVIQTPGDNNYSEAFEDFEDYYVVLYEVSEDADYVVGLANALYDNPEYNLVQVDVARNNNYGEVIDDAIYDEKTGLIYMPKEHCTPVEEDGMLNLALTQVQFTQFIDKTISETSVNFDLSVSSVRVNGEILDSGVASVDTTVDGTIALQLAENARARYSINEDYLTVKINSIEILPSSAFDDFYSEMNNNAEDSDEFVYTNSSDVTCYSYDSETGLLVLNTNTLSVDSIEIDIEKPSTFQQGATILADMFNPVIAFASDASNANISGVTVECSGTPQASASGTFSGASITYDASASTGAAHQTKYTAGQYIVVNAQNNAAVDINFLAATGNTTISGTSGNATVVYSGTTYHLEDSTDTSTSSIESYMTLSGKYKLGNVTLDFGSGFKVGLVCQHCTTVTEAVNEYNSIFGTANQDGGTGTYDGMKFHLTILSVDTTNKTMVLGIVTQKVNTQAGAMICKLKWNAGHNVSVSKTFTTNVPSNYVDNNPAYGAITDAKFTLYDSSNTVAGAATAVTAADSTNVTWAAGGSIKWKNIQSGSYTLKETTTPKNFTTSADTTVTVADKDVSVTVTNTPVLGKLNVIKESADTAITDNNPCYDLAGAEFKLTASWDSSVTFTSTTALDKSTGDVVAKFNNIPLGTYTLEETKSSKGYACVTAQTVTITAPTDNNTQTVTIEEPPMVDPVNVVMHKLTQDGSEYPVGDTSLENATFRFKYYNVTNVTQANEAQHQNDLVYEFTANTKYLIQPGTTKKSYMISLSKKQGCINTSSWKYYDKGDGTHTLDEYFNDNGLFEFGSGTVVITEEVSPEGYKSPSDDSGWKYVCTYNDGTATETGTNNWMRIVIPAQDGTSSNVATLDVFNTITVNQPTPILAGYKITKRDSKSNQTNGQGDAKLGAVTFNLYNRNSYRIPIYESDKKTVSRYVEPDGLIETVTLDLDNTDDEGNVIPYESVNYLLVAGTYEIVEIGQEGEYRFTNKEKAYTRTFTVVDENNTATHDGDGKIYDLTPIGESLSNDVYRGGVNVQKYDSETLQTIPQGDGSFAGAEFTIYNKSESGKSVWTLGTAAKNYTDTKEIKYGEAYCTITTDSTGLASTGNYVLPVGHYEIRETKAPYGYKLNEDWVREFDITEDNQMIDITQIAKRDTDVNLLKDSTYGCPETPIRGGIEMWKSDEDRVTSNVITEQGDNLGQGDKDLSGYLFYVVNASTTKQDVVVNGVTYHYGQVCYTLETDANGHATSDTDGDGFDETFPCGTYSLYEAGQGEQVELGYYVDADWEATVVIGGSSSDSGNIVQANSVNKKDSAHNYVEQTIWRGGVSFVKYDWDRDTNVAQGDATLKGCEFSIINRSKLPVYIDGTWYDVGEVCYTVTTDENGKAATPEKVLPYGTYEVIESKASTGYLVNPDWTRTFTIRKDGEYIHCEDTPLLEPVIRGDVQITKDDIELQKSEAMNGSDHGNDTTYDFTPNLSGINFEIYNASKLDVYVDQDGYGSDTNVTSVNGEWYEVGDLVTTITTHWNEEKQAYTAETTDRTLPYGTYLIKEVGTKGWKNNVYANDTYLLTDGDYRTFEIRKDGETVTTDTSNKSLVWDNQVVRGDFEFEKRETGTNQGMWTAWVVENLATGERHAVVTDKGGTFTSSYSPNSDDVGYPHSQNTNANDWILEKFDAGESINMADTDYTAGVWFGLGEDGTVANGESSADNTLGALPMGTYKIYEVKSDTNADYWDEPLFTEGRTFYIDGRPLHIEDLGTMENGTTPSNPTVQTVAVHDETGEHIGPATENTVIVDTVSYSGLKAGKTYYIEGTLMTKSGSIVYNKDENGENVAVTATSERFTVESVDDASGAIDMSFVFDAVAYEGQDVVAFETLYLVGEDKNGNETISVAASHKNLKDTNQTVKFPKIGTTAVVDGTETEHESLADGVVTIVDTVTYENLQVGKKYTIVGTFFDVSDNDEVRDKNGNAVTAKVEFTPTETSGTTEVKFEFDATGLEGHTIVAFEEVYYRNQVIATHANLNDTNQTISFPKVGTTANFSTGLKTGTKGETIIINDVVDYTNVIPGRSYTVTGVLMNKATGEVVKDSTTGKEVTSSAEFKADKADGTVTVTFEFDGSKFEDDEMVVFETLYNAEGSVVAKHEDLDDEEQTVRYPELETVASYCDTGSHEGAALDSVELVDYITYKGLTPNTEYTIKGVLMDKDSKAVVIDADGKEVRVDTTFIPEESSGTTSVTFAFNASELAGHSVVVFEEAYDGDVLIAEHKDIDSEAQTVTFPEVDTSIAVDNGLGVKSDEIATAGDAEVEGSDNTEDTDNTESTNEDVNYRFVDQDGKHVFTDTVYYKDLTPGDTYQVKGYLVDKATGQKVTSESILEITPEDSEGSVDITYEFDTTDKAGNTYVAYEYIYRKAAAGSYDVLVAQHDDINDEDQSVHVVAVKTVADIDTSTDLITVTDTVSYTGLVEGVSYTLTGTLMNPDTGKAYQNSNGEDVVVTAAFTAEGSEGTTEVVFNVTDVEDLDVAVVYEKLFYSDVEIAKHEDINDEAQTVYNPKVGTVATYGETNVNMGPAAENTVITDTVSYTGFVIGTEYVMKGTLYDKTAGKLTDITAETPFKAEEHDGTVEVKFEFDATEYAGHTFVVFEQAVTRAEDENGEVVDTNVVRHEDAEDADQTIYFPTIGTTLTDAGTGEHMGMATNDVTLVDRVTYTNLVPGKEYTVTGTLMDKATGKELLDENDHTITASAKFTPEEADGSIDITFNFKSIDISGKSVVAFERVEYEGVEVAAHTDINDDDQTVAFPSIATSAIDETTKTHQLHIFEDESAEIKIVDTVTYTNLIPGETYVITGTLMDKATGKKIEYKASEQSKTEVETTVDTSQVTKTDDNTITEVTESETTNTDKFTSSVTFKAEEANGTVDVEFTIPNGAIKGKTVVAFESLTYNDKTIATHEDIDDADQTTYSGSISTVATADDERSKIVTMATDAKVVDAITYENLVEGSEYKVVGQIVDKSDENKVVATATSDFKVEKMEGSVKQTFTVDTSDKDGHVLVCYETIYDKDGNIIAQHKDIEDKDQTVTVKTTTKVQTGIVNHARALMMIALIIMFLAVMSTIGVFGYRKIKVNDDNSDEE